MSNEALILPSLPTDADHQVAAVLALCAVVSVIYALVIIIRIVIESRNQK